MHRTSPRHCVATLIVLLLLGAADRAIADDSRIVGVIKIGDDTMPVDSSGNVVVGGQRIERKHIRSDPGAPKGRKCWLVCATLELGEPMPGAYGEDPLWARWCPDET